MAVTMTAAAAERVKSFLTNRGKGIGLRLGIKTTGCSGLAYVIEFVDDLNADDEVFAVNDVNIIIDSKSLAYLEGTELDFVKEGLNEGFQFTNPNAKGECGCGESFNV
ncbi:iron-sulfur cluster assembly protein IscA [Thalassotalea litorea]|uniref:Iron-binding protein IscA n=1 Tax=Thalassotalea litorea TaxID=2020715 RepID=A0A5R9IGG6_9GAMM|nr:iron-sulfur cluster assembly protein IscA [Thalassotalea litorea]TLU61654.1 iron-sulfur cluster assembly protein IscA [Thalassotalea litorea]